MKSSEKLEEKYSQTFLKIFNFSKKIWHRLMAHVAFFLSTAGILLFCPVRTVNSFILREIVENARKKDFDLKRNALEFAVKKKISPESAVKILLCNVFPLHAHQPMGIVGIEICFFLARIFCFSYLLGACKYNIQKISLDEEGKSYEVGSLWNFTNIRFLKKFKNQPLKPYSIQSSESDKNWNEKKERSTYS